MWVCTEGHPALAGDHFCRQCGGVVHRRCGQCQTYASDVDRACVACGAPLEDGAADGTPPPPPPGYTPVGGWSAPAGSQPGGWQPGPGAQPSWQQQPGWQTGWQQRPGQYAGWQQAWTAPGPVAAFGAPLAGWWTRVGAFVIDFFVLLVPTAVAQAIVRGASSSGAGSSTSTGASIAILLIGTGISGLYFGLLNGTGRGQTLGNMALGIGVRDAQSGAVIGFGRGVLRWVVRYLL